MRDGDNHIVVGIEVFCVEVAGSVIDVGAACVAKLFAYFFELLLDYSLANFGVIENALQFGNVFFETFVFVFEFGLLQLSKLAQTHFHDGLSLSIGKVEAFGQTFACLVG